MKKMIVLLSLFSLSALAGLSPLTQVDVDGRALLADSASMTVYTFDPDAPGQSNCYDGCARAWPPVLVPAGVELQAPLSAVTRRDGTQQIAINGQPLYLYVGDSQPGDIIGDGIGGVWHVVPAPLAPKAD